MATLFKYRPLDQQETQIRLISLHPSETREGAIDCSMVKHYLDGPGNLPYESVSYAWGDLKQDASILLDGLSFPVTETVDKMLRRLRNKKRDRLLWIDAICINQSDIEEKESQIAVMGKIYRAGQKNLVYLGDPHGKAELIIATVKRLRNPGRSRYFAMQETFDVASDEANALNSLFEMPWFRRLWVVQEATLPDTSLCILGDYRIPLLNIMRAGSAALRYVGWVNPAVSLSEYLSPNAIAGIEAASQMLTSYKDYRCQKRSDGDKVAKQLTWLLGRSNKRREVTREHDRVFGVLGIVFGKHLPVPPCLRPRYQKTVREVYRDAFRYIAGGTRSLVFLEFLHHDYDHILQLDGFPSWVPRVDLTGKSQNPYHFHTADHQYDKGKYLPPSKDPDVLEWLGSELDEVVRVSCRFSTEDFATRESLMSTFELIESFAGENDNVAVAKLVVGGHNLRFGMTAEGFNSHYSTLCEHLRSGKALEDLDESARRYHLLIRSTCFGRRVFRTRNGFVGLGPPAVSEGDTVALLYNCNWPVILRRLEDPQYCHIVGISWINTIMRGKAMKLHMESGDEDTLFWIK